jgi:hypothetical protein
MARYGAGRRIPRGSAGEILAEFHADPQVGTISIITAESFRVKYSIAINSESLLSCFDLSI